MLDKFTWNYGYNNRGEVTAAAPDSVLITARREEEISPLPSLSQVIEITRE
jgi:hypothetical protein